MARVKIHTANTIHSLGVVMVAEVVLVRVYHTNTGKHAKMETEGVELHILAAAQ